MSAVTFSKKSLSYNSALELIHAAIAEAQVIGFNISVSIVDESGIEKSFCRMDGAPLVSVETAAKKAKFAVGFGMPTGDQWYSFIKDDAILKDGAADLPGFILLGGGVPIYFEGSLIGAIGISGGHYKQDEQCANAAILKVYGAAES
jgi:uncharacterized protein GlcG (DUF336 family)